MKTEIQKPLTVQGNIIFHWILIFRKYKPNQNKRRQKYWQAVFINIAKKVWSVHFGMVRDGFDKKIWPVTDISHGSKEDRADADGTNMVGVGG